MTSAEKYCNTPGKRFIPVGNRPVVQTAPKQTALKNAGPPVVSSRFLRESVTGSDLSSIERLTRAAGNFTNHEINIALEVTEERLSRGLRSGYHYLWYTIHDIDCGFCCYGPIPCTINRFEIYWIVVDPARQHSGIGSLLLGESEKKIWEMGGKAVYLDTSSKESYRATRRFYEKNGYVPIAVLEDFYTKGDHKLIYRKKQQPLPR